MVRQSRRCSRSGCAQPAAATLTYVYAESTAVVGPLATYSEPHSYDLCEFHAERLTVPRGWEVVRHEIDADDAGPTGDDLLALADAVREAARPERGPGDDEAAGGVQSSLPRFFFFFFLSFLSSFLSSLSPSDGAVGGWPFET